MSTRGLLAEFASADALVAAVKRARSEGYSQIDAYTPFPIEGLGPAIGFPDEPKMGWIGFWGAVFGAFIGFFMQVYANLFYPLDIGGRRLIAVPAFLVSTFELMILFSGFSLLFGMLYLNGMPRLYHPVAEAESFGRATRDRFFLCIRGDDPKVRSGEAEIFLKNLSPVSLVEVDV